MNLQKIIILLFLIFFPILSFSQENVHCKGNCKDGEGKIKTKTLEYKGSFFNKLPHGYGKMKLPSWQYEGNFKNGVRDGYGTCVFDNKVVFKGEWDNNNMTSGKLSFPNGAYYEGGFVSNKFDGSGIYKYDTLHHEKQKYEGNFENGYFSGYGTMTYKNGKTETGIWELDNYLGDIVGTLNNQNVLYKNDTLYTLFDNKSYKFDEQKKYKLLDYNYFYLTKNNFIMAIVLFNNTKDTIFLISEQTDKELISHLNINQYNKPAKGSLTNICKSLFYDENKCFWILKNSEFPKILHFYRPDNNNKGINETVLFVENNNVQIVEDTYFSQHYRFVENNKNLKQLLYSNNLIIINENFHNEGWYNYAKFNLQYDSILNDFEKALWIGINAISKQTNNTDTTLNSTKFTMQHYQYISLEDMGIKISNNEFQLYDYTAFMNKFNDFILIDSVSNFYSFSNINDIKSDCLIFLKNDSVLKTFDIEIDDNVLSFYYSQFAYYNENYFISTPIILLKSKVSRPEIGLHKK